MTDTQTDKTNMFETVSSHITVHAATYAAYAQVATEQAALDITIAAIHANDALAKADISGYSEDKTIKREALTTDALAIVRGLTALAVSTSNTFLKNLTNYTKSEFDNARDSRFGDMCEEVYTRANANAAALVPFGVTGAELTTFNTNTQAYIAARKQPRVAKSEQVAYTTEVATQIAKADDIVKKLDTYCALIAADEPLIYNMYKSSREIISSGGGSGTTIKQGVVPGAGLMVVATDIEYIPSKALKVENLGQTSDMQICVKLEGSDVGSNLPLAIGAPPLTGTMDMFGAPFDELYIKNLGAVANNYRVTFG